MNTDCMKCRYGYTVHGPSVMRTYSGKTIIQNGGTNTTCMKTKVRNVTLTDDGINCSDYEPKEDSNGDSVESLHP